MILGALEQIPANFMLVYGQVSTLLRIFSNAQNDFPTCMKGFTHLMSLSCIYQRKDICNNGFNFLFVYYGCDLSKFFSIRLCHDSLCTHATFFELALGDTGYGSYQESAGF